MHDDIALVGCHVANINGPDTSGILLDYLSVDLRVALARVAYQDEGKLRVRREQCSYDAELMFLMLPQGGWAPVLEEERTRGDTMKVEEILQQIIEVPWTTRNVEDRVELLPAPAKLQGP